MEVNKFITKYYNEFGDKCPFLRTDMVSDEKELVKEFEPKLKLDIPFLNKFFNTKIDDLISTENKVFTEEEIEQLKYADHYWDIPKINFIYTVQAKKIDYNNLFLKAIEYNSLHILKWLNNIESWSNSNILVYEAKTMNYLPYGYATNYCNTQIFTHAAKKGNLPIMKWLLENNFRWDEDTFSAAVENGNLEILKWLRKNNCPWSEFVFAEAATKGDLVIMEWLYENKCPMNEYTMINAVKYGNIEHLDWLLERKGPLHVDLFSTAAETGNLEILKWLKKNDCPWDLLTFQYAAKNGNIENIKWLLDNDCPYSLNYIYQKVKNLRVLEWLNNNGYIEGINIDGQNTQWLLENGCPEKVVKILNIILQRNE